MAAHPNPPRKTLYISQQDATKGFWSQSDGKPVVLHHGFNSTAWASAYEDKLESKIDGAFFQRKRMEWQGEHTALLEDIERLNLADASNLDLGLRLIELGKSCVDIHLQQEADEQRKLLEAVMSNLSLGGEI